ncbi:MAG: aminodeoxychorismate synthase component I [Planctomycetales bacterium]|nr:aminodeoxychorismate synthase component I [Planctomycetales bacterium]
MNSVLRNAMPQLPLIEEQTPAPDVVAALRAFANWPDVLLFDSALQREPVGRYSFLTADPYRFVELPRASHGRNPFVELRRELSHFPTETVAGLPPFQGGAAGLLGYELGQAWERIPTASRDEFQTPALALGLYDWVLAWDHVARRAWIVSQGAPESDPARRADRAARRVQSVRQALSGATRAAAPMSTSVVPAERLAPQFPAPGPAGLTSNFSRGGYLQAIEQAIEYIRAGDIFQVNLSQRLLFPAQGDPVELYARLRSRNPAPFAGYFSHDDWVIASASPERFLSVNEGEVETRPIKGTRRRRHVPEADLFSRDELRESEKDQAENVMIVDLLRNDLSRVCQAGSIRVPALCHVETYETVQHLVSEIRGQLEPGRDAWDLLRATFPGGSITGAPKVRAMEIIAELEPTARGPYCGSLAYVGFDGRMDSSILIRTFTVRNGWIQCPVGGGIVAQSSPEAEYEETLHKAEGMLRALY